MIDVKTWKATASWPTAPCEGPTGIAYDKATNRIFSGCSNTSVVVDPDSGKVVASVPIGQGVNANAFDPGTQLAFSSCGDGTVTIAHEDAPDKLTVVQTLKTEPRAKTMALDPRTHKIYLASAKFEPRSAPRVLVPA